MRSGPEKTPDIEFTSGGWADGTRTTHSHVVHQLSRTTGPCFKIRGDLPRTNTREVRGLTVRMYSNRFVIRTEIELVGKSVVGPVRHDALAVSERFDALVPIT